MKQLSAGMRERHPDVPWRQIASMRDKLFHEYFGANLELVWNIVEQILPDFERQIEATL